MAQIKKFKKINYQHFWKIDSKLASKFIESAINLRMYKIYFVHTLCNKILYRIVLFGERLTYIFKSLFSRILITIFL